jgi:multicomponent Na+:H+ antiporter subunit F
MMFVVAGLAILATMGMALARMFAGPTLYDRILATNVFGTKTVLIIAVIGFIVGRPEFIDVAIVYALINFIGIVAVLKFFEYGSFGTGSRKSTDAGPPRPNPTDERPS